jgi:selenide,water dikinase
VTRLVLAGLGHAHLFVAEAMGRGELGPVEATVVSPAEYYYSGMIPGTAADCYPPAAARLCPEPISRAAGARWIWGRVRRVDAARREVVLEDGTRLPYDLLSIDVGAALRGDTLPGVAEHAIPIKPLRHVLRFRSAAARAAGAAADGAPARVVIVGAGAAGVEVGICVDAALRGHFGAGRHRMTLVHADDHILPDYPERFRRRAERLLRVRGVEIRTGARVSGVDPGRLLLEDGGEQPFDALLWATGPRALGLFRRSHLPTDRDGYLAVEPTLQSREHPEIWGAGDCVAIRGFPWIPKAGVYAVRQGPVLARNLRLALRGEPLEEYSPQREWLSLMNSGDGRALLHWRGIVAHNRAAWWLKDRLDRRFVRRFAAR